MVEVIKYNEERKQVTCYGCGCVLEYGTHDEYIEKEYDNFLRYETHLHFIICPACNRRVKTRERVYDML